MTRDKIGKLIVRLKNRKFEVFFLVGYLAAIVTLVTNGWGLFDRQDEGGKIGLFFFGLVTLFVLVDNILIRHRFNKIIDDKFSYLSEIGRESRYADVIPIISKGFDHIHKLGRKEKQTKEDIVRALKELCTCASDAFKLLTGEKCSVCIKIMGKLPELKDDFNSMYVETLCRDSSTSQERDHKTEAGIVHSIAKNTDFSYLFLNIGSPKGKYFYSNNLPSRYEYLNTSFELYGSAPPAEAAYEERVNNWNLPYKSTIVSPIGSDQIIGYLCVDSESIDVFKEKHDTKLLIGISQGIYNSILTILKLEKDVKPEEQPTSNN